ncbi:MAG: site-specific integrase [Pseudomonadota bacterium]
MAKTTPVNLNDAYVNKLLLPVAGEMIVRDATLGSFVLRLRHTGSKNWIVYLKQNGKLRKVNIGTVNEVPAADARRIAQSMLETPNPASSDAAERLYKPSVSFGDLLESFMETDGKTRWKVTTWRGMRRRADKYVLPTFGEKKAKAISRAEIIDWFEKLKQEAASAPVSLSLVKSVMDHAEAHGVRPVGTNPCARLQKKDLTRKGNYLSERQIGKLWRYLDRRQTTHPDKCDALRLLLLTGARSTEITHARWDQIHGNRIILEDSKTGPKTIWLNSWAVEILERRNADRRSDFIFPSKCGTKTMTSPWAFFQRIQKSAGLKGFRVHDLRHTFASIAAQHGLDHKAIKGLLGQRDICSTMAYSHLISDAETQSADDISLGIQKLLNKGANAGKKTKANRRSSQRSQRAKKDESARTRTTLCGLREPEETQQKRRLKTRKKVALGSPPSPLRFSLKASENSQSETCEQARTWDWSDIDWGNQREGN